MCIFLRKLVGPWPLLQSQILHSKGGKKGLNSYRQGLNIVNGVDFWQNDGLEGV